MGVGGRLVGLLALGGAFAGGWLIVELVAYGPLPRA